MTPNMRAGVRQREFLWVLGPHRLTVDPGSGTYEQRVH